MEKYHRHTLDYWKNNAEENYIKTPISVLKYITCLEEHIEQLTIPAVMRSRLSPGDKLICWAKGAAYGDTFTVQDSMYLQCDKMGTCSPLKDVDLSEFDYA